MQSITIKIVNSGVTSFGTGFVHVLVKRNGKPSETECKVFVIGEEEYGAPEAQREAVGYAVGLLQELNLLPNNQ